MISTVALDANRWEGLKTLFQIKVGKIVGRHHIGKNAIPYNDQLSWLGKQKTHKFFIIRKNFHENNKYLHANSADQRQ